jgi:protein-S-isoprenylcysteine O-methyltransferase Ste14
MHALTFIIAIGWIIFWLYWIISAFGSKKETHSNLKQFFRIRIVIWPIAIALVIVLKSLPSSLKNHYQSAINNRIVMSVGFLIFLLGFIIAIWARRHLGKNWGMPMAQKQGPELITSGPYAYIRHPIYTGLLLMAFGSFLIVNMYWLIVFIIAAVFFIYSAFAEEKLMTKQFPKIYQSYKAKTKMLIPFVF